MTAILSAAYPVAAVSPMAELPQGAEVTSGSANFNQSGSTLNISQNTQKLITNWDTFNIGSSATVNFIQPSSSSSALNRITTSTPSKIFGNLNANGQVFLINSAGVYFAPSSRVDTGGLVASTLNLSDADFLNDNYKFIKDTTSLGTIHNLGDITSKDGSYVAFISPTIVNEGTVRAENGSALLAAADEVTFSFDQDGLTKFTIDKNTVDGLIQNNGLIKVNQGIAILTAKAVDTVTSSVIQNSGTIEANSLVAKGGRILFEAEEITLTSSSMLDASGATGGGKVEVGGSWQNSDTTIAQATKVTMEAGATIDASATDNGDGGEVVLWSDITNADSVTQVDGHILARGGTYGGDGGRIETSGYYLGTNSVTGSASAANGNSGEWLFDPYNIIINQGASEQGGSWNNGDPDLWTANASNTSVVNSLFVRDQLNSGTSVTISTGGAGSPGSDAGDITVNGDILATSGSSATTLRLIADNNIIIKKKITTEGDVSLEASAQVQIDNSSANMSIEGNNIGISSSISSTSDAKDIAIIAAGTILIDGSASFQNSSTETVNLTANSSAADAIIINGDFTTSYNAAFSTPNSGDITINGNLDVTTFSGSTLSANTGNININGSGGSSFVDGQARFETNGNVSLKAASINFKYIQGASSGNAGAVSIQTNNYTKAINTEGNIYTDQTVTIIPFSPGYSIAINSTFGGASGLSLTTSHIADITYSSGASVPSIYIGDASTGRIDIGAVSRDSDISIHNNNDINFTGAVDLGTNNLILNSTGDVTQNSTAYIEGAGLELHSSNTVTLTALGNNVVTLAATGVGNVLYQDINSLSVGTVGSVNGITSNGEVSLLAGGISIDQAITATGNMVSLTSSGAITDGAGYISADTLAILGATSVTLDHASNNVATIAADSVGFFSYSDLNALSIGTIGSTNGLTSTGAISVATKTADLTISQNISGTSVSLNAGDNTVAGTSSGGNILLSGMPTITSSVGNTKLYTGSITGSTGLEALIVSGSGNFRYNSDETTSNFSLALGATGNYAIYREQPTLTFGATKTLSYGETAGNAAAISGLLHGDTAAQALEDVNAVTLTVGGASSSSSSSSGNYIVGDHTLNTSGTAVDKLGYALAYDSGTLTVTQKDLTATYTASNKVYDATTTVVVAEATTDIISGDTVTITETSVFSDKNALANKLINISAITLAGVDAANYSLTSNTATANADITQKDLAATYTGSNKVYDATTNIVVAEATTDIISGDTVTITETSVFSDKNASANKLVNISAIALAGVDAGNYSLTSSTATANADITQKDLTVTGLSSVDNKIYDATTTSVLNGAATVTALLSDSISLDGTAVGTFDDKNIGSAKAVTLSGNTLSGTDATNYNLIQHADLSADITQKDLTATYTASNKVYDATTTVVVAEATTDIISGDTVTITETSVFSDKNASANKLVNISAIALAGSDAANYSLTSSTATTTADISKAQLTITANNELKPYDGNPYIGAKGIIYSGFVNGETQSVLSGEFVNTGNSEGATDSGTYSIDPSGFTSANYNINYSSADLTIQAGTSSTTEPGSILAGVIGNRSIPRDTSATDKTLVPDGSSANTVGSGSSYAAVINDVFGMGGTFGTGNLSSTTSSSLNANVGGLGRSSGTENSDAESDESNDNEPSSEDDTSNAVSLEGGGSQQQTE